MKPDAVAIPAPMTDAEFEALTREFWGRREPGYDDVTFTVRRRGVVVRVVVVAPDRVAVTLAADGSAGFAAAPPAGPSVGRDRPASS